MADNRRTGIWQKIRSHRLYGWPALVYVLLSFVLALAFQLGDLVTTSWHSYQLLECLFNGQVGNFYLECSRGVMGGAAYELPIYIVFGLWNLPIFLINKIAGWNPQAGVIAYWSKFLLGLLLLLTARLVGQIIRDLDLGQKLEEHGQDLFLTAPLAYFSIVLLGCYDIFAVFLTLLGIHYLLRERRGLFLLALALASCFKYFALLAFLPLLLLTEKRPWPLLRSLVAVCALPALFWSLSRCMPGWTCYAGFPGGTLGRIGAVTYDVGLSAPGSWFAAVFFLICLLAYAYQPPAREVRQRFILYIPLVIYAAFFLLTPWHAQWTILLSPYLVLHVLFFPDRRRALLWTEALLFVAFAGLCLGVHGINEQLINMCSAVSYLLNLDKLQSFTVSSQQFLQSQPLALSLLLSLFSATLVAFCALSLPPLEKRAILRQQPPLTLTAKACRFAVILVFVIPAAACFIGSYLLRPGR
ncbi:MAG TPA: hypothetical protein PKY10_08325 [Lentisphaeria bacterium]|nr:hypothetical protein [Lentisphaeria bacterium]